MVTDMTDDLIVSLYLRRDEDAIRHSDEKYGRLLTSVAYNILYNTEDSRETVNDTYLHAWNSIPPTHPTSLGTYLSRITRNLSIDLWRKKSREKRKSEYSLSLDELSEVISSGERVEESLDLQELTDAIEKYLRTLSDSARRAFVMRYFFADPVKKIACSLGMGEGAVKSSLHRTRLGLREHLIKEGYEI
ncbi:MAG: sigma-70 family RNA polymerase sigma factor [Selenomonadales bacterium]|nr:sigma-70 family RNA polymerase sigma factor [Selenomonadales bacterium]